MNRAGTIVDSSVLLDVFTADPRWLAWSEEQLVSAAQRGRLILNAVVLRPRTSQYRWYCFGSASLPGAAADHPFQAEHSEKDH